MSVTDNLPNTFFMVAVSFAFGFASLASFGYEMKGCYHRERLVQEETTGTSHKSNAISVNSSSVVALADANDFAQASYVSRIARNQVKVVYAPADAEVSTRLSNRIRFGLKTIDGAKFRSTLVLTLCL